MLCFLRGGPLQGERGRGITGHPVKRISVMETEPVTNSEILNDIYISNEFHHTCFIHITLTKVTHISVVKPNVYSHTRNGECFPTVVWLRPANIPATKSAVLFEPRK